MHQEIAMTNYQVAEESQAKDGSIAVSVIRQGCMRSKGIFIGVNGFIVLYS